MGTGLCPRCPGARCVPGTNRIHSVLFGTQNRTLGPYLTAINRILISALVSAVAGQAGIFGGSPSGGEPRRAAAVADQGAGGRAGQTPGERAGRAGWPRDG
jgi:hypothetical protein